MISLANKQQTALDETRNPNKESTNTMHRPKPGAVNTSKEGNVENIRFVICKKSAVVNIDELYSDTVPIDVDDMEPLATLDSIKLPELPESPEINPKETTHQAATGEKEEGDLTVRLIFPSEDGGMLIGKDGRHINKLKHNTSATWTITRGNADQEDRIVTICGSLGHVAEAVYHLAEHINVQSRSNNKPRDSESNVLLLRLLFPLKSIGPILGTGGSRIASMRAKPGITRLHIYQDTIPFTQERIVEVCGTTRALETAVRSMLRATKSELNQLQKASILYQPVKNGLCQMILRENGQRASLFSSSPSSYRPHPKKHAQNSPPSSTDDTCENRKRSISMLDLDDVDSQVDDRSSSDQKRSRRMTDNGEYRYKSSRSHHSARSPDRSAQLRKGESSKTSRSRPPSRHDRNSSSSSSDRRRSRDERKEKLVIPDSVAGRLIGRSGSYLASLQSRSGAQITLSPRVPEMQDRVVTVSGGSDEVDRACRLIKSSVRGFERSNT
ncbi:RNA binding protein, heterogenous nuclear RNP-K like protein [Coemansia spiralis]|uniref:RNA binding protein, heterogenous nuclear RNP-K like protein n=2 Tax=Coemansia TaxID=4863 RepID=A0A9W8KYW1_9FUNG|nr:RNA binding protein, heterogenous nuclear RNP-K like protein [Coemansia umbellata]KAJ2623341.1 RNA binding protein, heterogenous nuclear RNP-K like protein [Coemansia sp. RSA 1358]KAJ2678111.1 RNA binding protein, heterogenous nuclear RNP-K like protein [Coemansia spiralis]